MKIVLSFFFVTLAMLQPIVFKNQSGSSFRIIKIHQTESGYSYFDSLAITSSEDFNAFLEELSRQLFWNNKQEFVDALLNAKVDFTQEALVLLRYDQGSGSTRVSFETPVLQEKTLLCEIRGEILGMRPAVMAYHCFALVVSKSLVNKVQLNVVEGLPEIRRPTILLSTTERQALKFLRHDHPPPRSEPSDCPKLTLACPTETLETGKTYEIKLTVEGLKPQDNVAYNWSVSPGEIVGGQGTRTLVVRINRPNEIVKAWVSLGGIDPSCDAVANCSSGPQGNANMKR